MSRLQGAGFLLVSTARLELAELLKQSIKHIAPFPERDRGFRDAVILESIASHAIEHYQHPNILVISLDKGFQGGHSRLTAKGLTAHIVSPSDCEKLLEGMRVAAVGRFLAEGDPTLNTFLQRHKERIFDEVRAARVDLLTIKGGMYGVPPEGDPLHNSIVRRVNAVHPVAIERGLPGMKPIFSEIPPGRAPIRFEVSIDVDLAIERTPNLFGSLLGQEIPLDQPVDVDPFWRSPVQQDRVVEDVTVRRSLHVEASVIHEPGAREEYHDLQIHRVW